MLVIKTVLKIGKNFKCCTLFRKKKNWIPHPLKLRHEIVIVVGSLVLKREKIKNIEDKLIELSTLTVTLHFTFKKNI